VEYNKEYSTPYDVTKLTDQPEAGKAGIEAFFTTKGNDLYAILPHWSGHSVILKDITGVKSVSLLGLNTPLKFKMSQTGMTVELPELPQQLRQQAAWTLKISHQ
jgi:alpha-L-fucosidase